MATLPAYEQGSAASSRLSPDKDTPSSSTVSRSQRQLTPVSNGSDTGSDFQPRPHHSRSFTPPAHTKGESTDDESFGSEGVDSDLEELERKYRQADSASPGYTIDEERQVVRKFDRKLVPFLALLYLLSFLDRSSKD